MWQSPRPSVVVWSAPRVRYLGGEGVPPRSHPCVASISRVTAPALTRNRSAPGKDPDPVRRLRSRGPGIVNGAVGAEPLLRPADGRCSDRGGGRRSAHGPGGTGGRGRLTSPVDGAARRTTKRHRRPRPIAARITGVVRRAPPDRLDRAHPSGRGGPGGPPLRHPLTLDTARSGVPPRTGGSPDPPCRHGPRSATSTQIAGAERTTPADDPAPGDDLHGTARPC